MKVVVKYFYTICQYEQRKEIIRQMIAEHYDENLQYNDYQFGSKEQFLEFIFPYRSKSLNKLGENKNLNLCQLLISELISTQQIYEDQLTQLKCIISQTEILQIYKEIDNASDGFIDVIKLYKYLQQKCGFQASNEDLIFILRRLDIDEDGYISLAEFLNEFISESKPQSQMSTMAQTRQPSLTSSQTQFTPPYSEDCLKFAQFLKQVLQGPLDQDELNFLKRQFIKQKKHSFLTLFEDIAHSMYLDKKDLQNLLQYYKLNITGDLGSICQLLNKENPEQIEFQDFLNFFTF